MLWRRLDTPGHDACRIQEQSTGCQMNGTAVFQQNGVPVQLAYHVACDKDWRTRLGTVRGFLGTEAVDVTIERAASGAWTFNGRVVDGFEPYIHLDFGFTPATNFQQLRQLALSEGQAADLPVVWLNTPLRELQVLPQRYERRSELTYWYEAPSVGYAALLELTPSGLVHFYPGLWKREA